METLAFWERRATLPNLNAVLDPAQRAHLKNSYLDFVQKRRLKVPLQYFSKLGTILDFGCGIGRMTKWLGDQTGSRVIGFDPTETMLKRARENYPSLMFYDRTESIRDTIDMIFTLWVLQHIPNEDDILHSFDPILKHKNTRSILIFEKTGANMRSDHAPGETVPYQRIRTVSEYECMFRKFGFTLQKMAYVRNRTEGIIAPLLGTGICSRHVAKLFPLFFHLESLLKRPLELLRIIPRNEQEVDTWMLFERKGE